MSGREYTVVIRTLGKAGSKYQQELDSICSQTLPPKEIIVYLAEGYDIPEETCGRERYVYVKKGMVSQRALKYEEVQTEWILFLDDDVYLPENAVETLFREIEEADADVISPSVFSNHKATLKHKVLTAMTGKELPLPSKSRWGYKVLPTGGFAFNNNPIKPYYISQTNAGPCFLCRKQDFLRIDYKYESWLEQTMYALPDDQVMFYKMYLRGLKQLTSFDSGIVHLDAGTTMAASQDKLNKLIYSEYHNKLVFWHRFIYQSGAHKLSAVPFVYAYTVQAIKYGLKALMGSKDGWNAFSRGVYDALSYIGSEEYKRLPAVKR